MLYMVTEDKRIYIQIDGKRVEAKGEVLEQILKDRADYEAQQRLIEAEQTKKDADRASAMAKLSKLGLTDDEIASLIP
jgi:regulator of protease activity HflC (stomatin/prohibitin superfamily)